MGRPRKALHLHVLEGTRRARHAGRENELHLPAGSVGACPSWLPPEGKEEWKRLTTDKHYSKCLAAVHRGALIDYCNLYGRMIRSERGLPRWLNGRVYVPKDRRESKVETLAASERNAMHALRTQLGLTPGSQSKVQLANAAEQDEWAQFDGA